MKEFLTGSKAFFSDYEDFQLHDIDIIKFNPEQNHAITYIEKIGYTTFIWKYNKAQDIIDYLLNSYKFSSACIMLLIPDIIKEVGMTFDKLPQLKPIIDKLDNKHKYIEVIYNAYLENGKFELTKEQLDSAYAEYKRERKRN